MARKAGFGAEVNDPRGLGPPVRGPELLVDPPLPISVKARVDIMLGFLVLARRPHLATRFASTREMAEAVEIHDADLSLEAEEVG